MSAYNIYYDANILLDFSIDQQIFNIFSLFLQTTSHQSIHRTSSIIVEKEINKSPMLKQILQHINIEDIDAAEFMLFLGSQPELEKLDEGEISLYFLATKNNQSCIMTNDKKAREVFKSKSLLPCTHINPPAGGTRGILTHLQHHNHLSQQQKEQIEQTLTKAGRKI